MIGEKKRKYGLLDPYHNRAENESMQENPGTGSTSPRSII
jgi:hypothetical protein